MNSQTLREARRYEEATEPLLNPAERPSFHLASRVGWMNDPNGFSYYKGQYHLFYQYHPYGPYWGPMHWGHAVSKDLLHWSYLPAALAPDTPWDRDGCFSGSAFELPDGRQVLMYTGVMKIPGANGEFQEFQRQCLAVGDGLDYEKYAANPVLDGDDLPLGCSRTDFRDPKVWKKADGTYRCVVGNRSADGSGQILLFVSENGFDWKYEKVLIKNDGRFGKMWECPDFFSLDGKQVLLTSPQEMLPRGFEYHNGNGTLCLIGTYDEDTDTFREENDQSIDYGIDFYAPQTVMAPDGRRIMIGWMQNWDTCTMREPEQMWYGQMSLPRELSIRNGRLIQKPLRELEALREDKVSYQKVEVNGEVRLNGVEGRKIDMELRLSPVEGEPMYRKFAVRFAQNDMFYTALSFRPQEAVLKIDRKFSGSRKAIIHQRRSLVQGSESGKIKLRIILDQCSVEVFVNDGIQVMTATLYTDGDARGISFYADGAAQMDVVKYELKI
ncbi:MAG: glycoside hydrolase family 32 protein [Lachnospiraceae bacterium]|nr:glycoside hydrolase family 32 protein [Lachnospiraceae bacterium]